MVFNYGETLRIRRDLYTILGKIRYIDTHGKIGYEYKLVRHKNNAEFWLSWDKKRDAYQFSKLCGKALPADMKLIDSGYEMVTGTWGEVDVGTTDTAKYLNIKSMKMLMVLLRFLFKSGILKRNIQKAFTLIKNTYLSKRIQR